jgi:hypothetical protein
MTAAVFLQRAADMRDFDWNVGVDGTGDASTERRRRAFVSQINFALSWFYKDEEPNWAWPWNIATATVNVTSDKVAASSLAESGATATWCSLWSADPQVIANKAYPIRATRAPDHGALLVRSSLPSGVSPATVFAFYRKVVPQITYVAGGSYTTPDIPDESVYAVLLYAQGINSSNIQQTDAVPAFQQQAMDWLSAQKDGLYNTAAVWNQNGVAL